MNKDLLQAYATAIADPFPGKNADAAIAIANLMI